MLRYSRPWRWTAWCVIPTGLIGGALGCARFAPTRCARVLPLFLIGFAGVIAAGVGILRARRRGLNRIRELERQHTLEIERIRIAQDMHDSLGADLTRIVILAEVARHQPGRAGVLQQIERIATISRDLVDSLNELVWATNPRHNTVGALAAYLREYASELLEPAGLSVHFDFPRQLPAQSISGELRRNLFLATKEALNNALKHARATEVRLAFALFDHQVEIVVWDNGCGFHSQPPDPAASHPNLPVPAGYGNGLRNLRERLASAGGVVQLASATGKGTRVSLSAPLVGPLPASDTNRQLREPPARQTP